MGLSKQELKACYWTEGVPSVKKTGFGRKTAVQVAMAASSVVVVAVH